MTTTSISGFAPAHEMLRALRERQISAVELLDLHLRRIERYNPTLNAIVTPDFEAARKAAEAADAARARGEDGLLLGLPMTIKDCIDLAGLPGTAGVPDFAERRPAEDARIVARARAAGAVFIGKTNVPPMAGDWQSDNPVFGRTVNPWNAERTPGGSTGGGAAALAAGLTPLELGSDIGGSIRVPAAYCGVWGHRPSETALPRSGHFPGVPLPNPASVMGVQGPLARSAEDLELALDVVAGPDVGEDVAWRLQLPLESRSRLSDYRVAVMPALPWLPVDDDILAAQERLAGNLSAVGAIVRTAGPEAFGDLRGYMRTYLSLLTLLTSQGQPEEERRGIAQAIRKSKDEFLTAQADGMTASAIDFMRWLAQREEYRAVYRRFFKDWDVLISPVALTPAFPHVPATAPFGDRTLAVNGRPVPYMHNIVYPALCTLAGQPATAFPQGLSHDGLPVGLQAIGPYLEDRTPIRFAALIARTFGGYERPAGYDE